MMGRHSQFENSLDLCKSSGSDFIPAHGRVMDVFSDLPSQCVQTHQSLSTA